MPRSKKHGKIIGWYIGKKPAKKGDKIVVHFTNPIPVDETPRFKPKFTFSYHPLHMDVPPKEYAAKRSPKWPAVRKAWLTQHPYCAVCGIRESLEVHHIMPFHLKPELELDPTNFMTLCEGKTRTCHFIFGHFYNWYRFNANIREDAAVWTRKFEREKLA